MHVSRTLLVTGGAGFIGSRLVAHLLDSTSWRVVNLDKLAYSGSQATLAEFHDNPRHRFVQADLADARAVERAIEAYRPSGIIHLAAESHVDRSIDEPSAFIDSNIVGAFNLLTASLAYWRELPAPARDGFRLLHVSTDEVFGHLDTGDAPFTEQHAYAPRSPYAASKAAADHLARAWHTTYGLPVMISNCSNNYGPYQFPEKLIPLAIGKALTNQPIPLYGDGANVRDWLFVADHVRALMAIFEHGQAGRSYNIGANQELSNAELLHKICRKLDELRPRDTPYSNLITHVVDRPGHDRRYAMDASRIRAELGWRPTTDLDSGLDATIRWYLANQAWCDAVTGGYSGERIGLGSG